MLSLISITTSLLLGPIVKMTYDVNCKVTNIAADDLLI